MISARDAFVDTRAFSRERAKPLAPDERRAAILDAVIPLLREHGRSVSSRQMAEAAGVAEGTLFRAFGDKESIVQAAVERYLDPEPFRNAMRGIDPDDPAEEKLRQVIRLLRERFQGVIGFMDALQLPGPPKPHPRAPDAEWIDRLRPLFRDDEIAVPIETLALYLRLVAFGASIPFLNRPRDIETDELARLVAHGVLPPERTGPCSDAS